MKTLVQIYSKLRHVAPLVVLCAFAAASSAASFEGRWKGAVDLPSGKLDFSVTLAREGQNWSGKLTIPAQGVKDWVLQNVSGTGSDIRFTMPNVPGDPTWEGRLDSSGNAVSGNFKQGASRLKFTMRRAAPDEPDTQPDTSRNAQAGQGLEGFWLGTIEPGLVKLRLLVKIEKTKENRVSGMLDSVDQGAKNLPIAQVTLEDGKVQLLLPGIGVRYEGRFSEDRKSIKGEWLQGGQSFPVEFKWQAKEPVFTRPQEPKKPYPYQEEEVVIENESGGVKLAGTLTLPQGNRAVPAAILITGSGPQDRDESLMGHKPFLVLADHLTRQGIAVLRMDDRGVGGSTGELFKSTTEDLAGDIQSAFTFLKGRKEIDGKRIGLIGHSEGGMIAPVVAAKNPEVAFIVLAAAPGVATEKLLQRQMEVMLAGLGVSPEGIDLSKKTQLRAFELLRTIEDNGELEERLRALHEESKALLSETDRELLRPSEAGMEMQFKMLTTPWFKGLLRYDPVLTLAKVECPVLALTGEKDTQVDPAENLPALKAALQKAGHEDYKTVELPGLNHLFQTAQTGLPQEYSTIEETFSPKALETISSWIQMKTRAGRRAAGAVR